MKAFKVVPIASLALLWVKSVAFAGEVKPIAIQTFSVQDISNISSSFNQPTKQSNLSLSKTGFAQPEAPRKNVQVFKTEAWMNYVQMNSEAVFVQLKF